MGTGFASARRTFPLLVVVAIILSSMAAIGKASRSRAALVAALGQGGYVLVMRHASAPPEPPEANAADAENRSRERQLDSRGRETARAMGEALRRLHIPIGGVLSSPAYRAVQTARLVSMGEAKTAAELDAGLQGMDQQHADSTRSAWLRRQVAVKPSPHLNTLIVTHAPNILGAFGEAAAGLSDGETIVFRPDGHGGAELIARLRIEEWPGLGTGD